MAISRTRGAEPPQPQARSGAEDGGRRLVCRARNGRPPHARSARPRGPARGRKSQRRRCGGSAGPARPAPLGPIGAREAAWVGSEHRGGRHGDRSPPLGTAPEQRHAERRPRTSSAHGPSQREETAAEAAHRRLKRLLRSAARPPRREPPAPPEPAPRSRLGSQPFPASNVSASCAMSGFFKPLDPRRRFRAKRPRRTASAIRALVTRPGSSPPSASNRPLMSRPTASASRSAWAQAPGLRSKDERTALTVRLAQCASRSSRSARRQPLDESPELVRLLGQTHSPSAHGARRRCARRGCRRCPAHARRG